MKMNYKLIIYTTGLNDVYFKSIKYLKNVDFKIISSRFLYLLITKLSNFLVFKRILEFIKRRPISIEEREKPTNLDIMKSLFSPFILLFNKNIMFSYVAYSNIVYFMLLLSLLGKNTIYFTSWPHWNTNRYIKKPLFNKYLWNIFLKRTKIVAVSKAAYNSLKSNGYNVVNISYAVDTNLFKPSKIKNKKIRILHVGRIIEEKGILDILDVASRFDEDKVEFIFAGEGTLSKLIMDKEKELPVEYLGYVKEKELAKLYRNCDIFILNSYSTDKWEEWYGRSLLEAMSSGLSVIATDCIGPKEIIGNNKVGFLIKQKDKQDLYNKLKILINNKKLREKFGRNGRRLILEKYNIEENSKRWLKLLINYA